MGVSRISKRNDSTGLPIQSRTLARVDPTDTVWSLTKIHGSLDIKTPPEKVIQRDNPEVEAVVLDMARFDDSVHHRPGANEMTAPGIVGIEIESTRREVGGDEKKLIPNVCRP